MRFFHRLVILLPSLFLLASTVVAKPIKISIPEQALQASLHAILPLAIQSASDYMDGTLVIDSIRDLHITPEEVTFQGQVTGRNLSVKTVVLGQPLELNVKSLQMFLQSKVSVRFDKARRILYLKPTFLPLPSQNTSGQVEPLLALAEKIGGKEYPVDLRELQPLIGYFNGQEISLQLDLVDLVMNKEDVQILLTPKARLDAKKRIITN